MHILCICFYTHCRQTNSKTGHQCRFEIFILTLPSSLTRKTTLLFPNGFICKDIIQLRPCAWSFTTP